MDNHSESKKIFEKATVKFKNKASDAPHKLYTISEIRTRHPIINARQEQNIDKAKIALNEGDHLKTSKLLKLIKKDDSILEDMVKCYKLWNSQNKN